MDSNLQFEKIKQDARQCIVELSEELDEEDIQFYVDLVKWLPGISVYDAIDIIDDPIGWVLEQRLLDGDFTYDPNTKEWYVKWNSVVYKALNRHDKQSHRVHNFIATSRSST